MLIRPEQHEDAGAIDRVHRLAFGRDHEAAIVRAVRASRAYIPELSLVAEVEERITGHILFSVIDIETAAGPVPSLALAPLAVEPAWQNRGIGSALVREGLSAAGRSNYTSVIVLGHPGFYRRFGFRPAVHRGIHPPFKAPADAFLALELVPGTLAGVRGTVRYSPPFEAVS